MKLAAIALFLMLSLFFVSALDEQKQAEDPSMKTLADEEEEDYPFDEEDYEEENADAADRATNRDLGYGYGYGYSGGYHSSYSSYRGNGGHSYSYGTHYTRPAVVYHEPRVVRRYYNYYRGRSKGKGRS